jgi:hypothetical protein
LGINQSIRCVSFFDIAISISYRFYCYNNVGQYISRIDEFNSLF